MSIRKRADDSPMPREQFYALHEIDKTNEFVWCSNTSLWREEEERKTAEAPVQELAEGLTGMMAWDVTANGGKGALVWEATGERVERLTEWN